MLRPISGLFSPKTNSYLSKLVTWILKLRDIFAKTLAWFVSPWKSVRPIPVLRWGWWFVFQHGQLTWAPPSWILNSPPDWLKITSAILDLENNRVYCSQNNSLLSFSAPDWLRPLWARYSSHPLCVRRNTTLIFLVNSQMQCSQVIQTQGQRCDGMHFNFDALYQGHSKFARETS